MSTDIPLRFIGLSPASLVLGHPVEKAVKPNTVLDIIFYLSNS